VCSTAAAQQTAPSPHRSSTAPPSQETPSEGRRGGRGVWKETRLPRQLSGPAAGLFHRPGGRHRKARSEPACWRPQPCTCCIPCLRCAPPPACSPCVTHCPVPPPPLHTPSRHPPCRAVVSHVAGRYPGCTLFAAGWSLGANILVNYLAEAGAATPVEAAVSMCNPFELTISNAALKQVRGLREWDAGRGEEWLSAWQLHAWWSGAVAACNRQAWRGMEEASKSVGAHCWQQGEDAASMAHSHLP
jgi:hypothetical protein